MKKILKAMLVVVYVAASLFIATLLFVAVVAQYHPAVQRADAIIVLGAAINTPASYNRSLQGLRLYNEGDAPVIVLSGGVDYPRSISEAEYMRRAILANSSTTPNMLLEPDSHSTYDNIENSKKLLPNVHSVIIVSDNFHIARAVLMARAAGFSPVYWSSPDTDSYYPLGQLIYYYIRETAAMFDYIPKFILGR